MTYIDHAIDTYRDNELNDYLDKVGKPKRTISIGPPEDDQEFTITTTKDIEEFFRKKEENK